MTANPPSAPAPGRVSAEAAARLIRPGDHVFVGTASATPRLLLQTLESMPNPPADVELMHFLIDDVLPTTPDGRVTSRYRHRSFFVGAGLRAAVRQGVADYAPVPVARLPELMRNGRIRVDVALIQCTPPDAFGYVSLGVSVDVVAAAVECARLVIAEVNPQMPWTMGDTTLHVGRLAAMVNAPGPLPEYRHPPTDDATVQRIARYIASIIEDGSTLQIGMGRIPQESLRHLDDRRDLGMHTDVVTDAILPLLDKGILTGAQKTQQRRRIVCSFAFGSRALYERLDRNALFSFAPIDAVCSPASIGAQHRMVSVTQVFAVDLTGQACSDQFDGEFYGGIGTQGDFLRGASRSPGGKPILCLASATDDGRDSRIRAQLHEGEGVSIARTDVHYVITEYGIAYLFGKTVRERAIALIDIAHPSFRATLLDQAKALGYLPREQTLENMRAYPVEEERRVTLKDGRSVLLRPARASDASGIRDLFFQLPEGDVYTRFFRRVRALSAEDIRRLCNYDQDSAVGYVAVQGPRENEVIVGQACYFVNPSSNTAEVAYLVHGQWQGHGLGNAMQRRLAEHAKARGLRGFTAEILPQNGRMLALARGGEGNISVEKDEDSVIVTTLFA